MDDKLIVNLPGNDVTLIALDPKTGKLIWKGPGDGTGYGSFIVADLGGKRQLIGHDRTTLGGWDIASGKRLWSVTPGHADDFNVPTPVVSGEHLVVSTENNGTRLYKFNKDGKADPSPIGQFGDLKPDTHSPVGTGHRLFGVSGGRLHCLDLANNLKLLWEGEDSLFSEYAAIIASDNRVLVIGHNSELLLIDANADRFKPLGRMKLIDDESGVYAHPAIVGKRMYFRSNDAVLCVDLGAR